MNLCPVTSFDDLRQQAFDHVRYKDVSRLVAVEHEMLYPIAPERLQLGTELWTQIGTPMLPFQVGLGFQVKLPEWKCTHLHADLETGSARLHIDYFSFATWGPVGGVLGYIVSLDGTVLGAGSLWAQPLAGGRRNWPLGVLIGSQQLLTAYSVHGTLDTFKPDGDTFFCEAITLWRKTNPEDMAGTKRTAEEQSCIDAVARDNGKEWAESHAELILDQAREIGDL